MRVENGLEAVHLLLASKRVTDDLLQALEAENQCGVPYDLSIVVREWSQGVREDAEFRGFMGADGRLVAVSQYNEYFFQHELWEHREAIIQNLVGFVEQSLRPRLLGTCFLPCVLDLVIMQAGLHCSFDPQGDIRVVELNPANERTSTALFDKAEVLSWVSSESPLCPEFRLAKKLVSEDGRFLQNRVDEAHGRWRSRELFRDAL